VGRWKASAPPSSAYITPEGYKGLELELKSRWDRRRETTKALAIAAAEGDRSENAEYIYRKKELREIDRRIRFLQKRMPNLKIVTQVGDKNRIFFGAWVTLEDEEERQMNYRIVGPDELNTKEEYISIDSPMAKALLKKAIDDEVRVTIGEKDKSYFVLDIKYNL